MAFKLVVLACLVAAASAIVPVAPVAYSPSVYSPLVRSAPLVQAAPLAYAHPVAKVAAVEEYDPHPQYNFAYDVQDGLTGDSKSQQESRDGDVVQGSYSVVDPDGTRRVVDYTADPVNGFNAVVRKEPLAQVAKVIAPVARVAAAPIPYASPILRASPVIYH